MGKRENWLERLARALIVTITILLQGTFSAAAEKRSQVSAQASTVNRAPASQEVSRALDVKGQMRNWARMMGTKGQRDVINFVRKRTDYREEIENSSF